MNNEVTNEWLEDESKKITSDRNEFLGTWPLLTAQAFMELLRYRRAFVDFQWSFAGISRSGSELFFWSEDADAPWESLGYTYQMTAGKTVLEVVEKFVAMRKERLEARK